MPAFGATGAFSYLVDMIDIGIRYRVPAKAHDRVGEMRALVGFNPWFYIAAAGKQRDQQQAGDSFP